MNICSKYARDFDIAFNPVKTKCMAFRPPAVPWFNERTLVLGDTALGFVDEITYLGHIIHNSLSDVYDVKKQLQKLNTIGNVALRKFGACSKEVKCKIFRAHCSNIYCSYLWSDFTVAAMRKLRVCHNDILRRMTDVPRWNSATAMFAREHLDNLDVLLRKMSYGFRARLQTSKNPILNAIYECHGFECSELFRRWRNIIEIVR